MATEDSLVSKESLRSQLYSISDDPELSLSEKQRQVLELGRQALDVSTAHIQHQRDDDTHEIVVSVGSSPAKIPEGVTLDRATTYCRRTIETTSPLALANAPEEGWADDPAYEQHNWDCYLGTTIFVDGDSYGTVCFVAEAHRETAFSADEKALVELIARLVGRAIETAQHQQQLEATTKAKQRATETYEAFLQLSPNAVVVADAETGRIETANSEAASLTGYTTTELRGMSVLELHPDSAREQYAELLASSNEVTIKDRFDDGEPLYIRRADGTDVPIELSCRMVELDDQQLQLGVIRNLTEQREREAELKRQHAFLEQTQETVNLGGWELDFETGFSQATDEIFRIFDQPLDTELSIEVVYDRLHPDDRQSLKQAFERLETAGESFDLTLRLDSDDGVRCVEMIGTPIEDDDSPNDARGIVNDITDRKAQQRDLHLKDRAIEESSIGITVADADDPKLPIVYANQGFEEMTGYARSEIIGHNCRFLQGSGTDEATVNEIRAAVENKESIQTDLLNYRADGTPFWNRLTISPVTGVDTDEITHFVGVQKDITAEKRRDRLITVLDRVLRHNIRNEMNVISGYSDTIAERADGEIASMAQQIRQTARELTALTETVRDFETEISDTEPLADRDIVADVETVVADLRTEYPATDFCVTAEAELSVRATQQLQVALKELGDNAAKHTDSEIKFAVTTEESGTVSACVHDKGPGLPDGERHVLETGQETPLKHGSGLGLWLVNWIITSLGGEIAVTCDGGTTVTIQLPKAAETDADRAAATGERGDGIA